MLSGEVHLKESRSNIAFTKDSARFLNANPKLAQVIHVKQEPKIEKNANI